MYIPRCKCMKDGHSLEASLSSFHACQHTSAYVSVRQRTSAYVSISQHKSAYVSIRWRPLSPPSTLAAASQTQCRLDIAYVSIRQHTSAYVSIRACGSESGGQRRSVDLIAALLTTIRRAASSCPHPQPHPQPAYVSIREHT
jgi:hypothetical protein